MKDLVKSFFQEFENESFKNQRHTFVEINNAFILIKSKYYDFLLSKFAIKIFLNVLTKQKHLF